MARYLTGDRVALGNGQYCRRFMLTPEPGSRPSGQARPGGRDPGRPGGARPGRRDGRFRDPLRIRAG